MAGEAPGACDATQLRQAVERALRVVAVASAEQLVELQAALEAARAERREFWTDTCRDMKEMRVKSQGVHTLYQQHGCRFCAPSIDHVQYILNALDAAVPYWDGDHPELFYQTLELNFPELLRHR